MKKSRYGWLLAALTLLPVGVSAVEVERVLVPRYYIENGKTVLRMVPVFRPKPQAPGLLPGLPAVDDATWDETAVRKVLHVFAFGSHATDAQIRTWANASPQTAIVEMLRFDEHNLRLSPADGTLTGENLHTRSNKLHDLGDFWSGSDAGNYLPPDRRQGFRRSDWSGAFEVWTMAARARGGNPFRHRVGFWESNFHLAINHRRGVSNYQIVKYYDDVMEQLRLGSAYHRVIATGSLSAAIGQQYGHRYNRWYDDVCYCNEDFAREFHQLGFGILGIGDTEYHETVSIKNTAAALTGMDFTSTQVENEWEAENVVFNTDGHVPGPVEILHQSIAGLHAGQKVTALAGVDIGHPESLANLPLMIVQGMADDQISPAEALELRQAWRSMTQKNLLTFLRAYAISKQFHSPNRIKQWTSIERFLLLANRYTHGNLEQYYEVPQVWRLYWDEEVVPFEPHHDVFGHQTGLEAAGSAEIFRKHFGAATDGAWRFLNVQHDFGGTPYVKDWRQNLPAVAGQYPTRNTAEWLWQRFVADGLKNFGPLERAHVYALLAQGDDLSEVVHTTAPDTPVTLAELTGNTAVIAQVNLLAATNLPLGSADPNIRNRTNERIGAAINFIIATPFMLAQEGR